MEWVRGLLSKLNTGSQPVWLQKEKKNKTQVTSTSHTTTSLLDNGIHQGNQVHHRRSKTKTKRFCKRTVGKKRDRDKATDENPGAPNTGNSSELLAPQGLEGQDGAKTVSGSYENQQDINRKMLPGTWQWGSEVIPSTSLFPLLHLLPGPPRSQTGPQGSDSTWCSPQGSILGFQSKARESKMHQGANRKDHNNINNFIAG